MSHLRPDPTKAGLTVADLGDDPLAALRAWLDDARAAGLDLPEQTVLATASPEGRPSARAVLIRGVDDRGIVFYTSYESRKGGELAANPQAALCSVWSPLQRQVRVEGRVRQLPGEESDAYWVRRPPLSRLAAAVSTQSAVVDGRDELEEALTRLAERYPDGDVPRPVHWGGYVLRPETVEFWLGRDGRLHDRLRYRRDGDGWVVERLAP